ncbi:hypothetical protein AS850_15840 [Frondihabitans sp. 762G35]|uniref:DUF4232 domain-containing protein n=1 Tax=Frondihabitans sp. 762G35 TaxID=1446794 RepID=UPI000D20CBE3|nr:DUF4232 domain-containing protein [Frondihabitans sp. 762G35]ARC58560.1 hypothetical protein AS850_15840 [Frondihabitans sp. 762G35]
MTRPLLPRARLTLPRARLTAAGVAFAVAMTLAGCSSAGVPTATDGTTPRASSTVPSFRSSACAGDELSGAVSSGDGGAAGSILPDVVVTNTSATSCVLTGWPSVALVAAAGGPAIGSPSQRNEEVAHPTVTLPPRGTAIIPIRITQALNYPSSTCVPRAATGISITPPGSSKPLYVALPGLTGCSSDTVKLITVSAVLPAT